MTRARSLFAALLGAALLLLVGAPTLAVAATSQTPSPTPTPSAGIVRLLQFSGTGHTVSTQGGPNVPTGYPSTAILDCTGDPCLLTVSVTDTLDGNGNPSYQLQGTAPVAFRGTTGSYRAPALGGVCDDEYVPAGTLTVTVTDTTLTAVRTFDHVGSASCPNQSSVQYPDGYQSEITDVLVSGSGCIITKDCPTLTPTPTASVAPVGAVVPGRTPHPVRIAEPSTLSVLPTVSTAVTLPNVIWAVAATVVLVLLIALPSHLLNTATEAGTDRVSEWWKAARARARASVPASASARGATADAEPAPPPKADEAPIRAVNFAGWPIAAAGVLAASLISSFIDPSFGFNAASIRVFLSILLSFLLDAVLGWFLLILLVRRGNPQATARFRFAPASLVVVVIAVLFTRLTGFQPGIVFGLVAGVVFGAVIATNDKARLALISLGYSFVLAIVGWVGYSAIAASAGAHPAAPLVFLQETLSAMAIGGIAALPIALVPLRGLAGYEIWSWNRWVWGGGYVIGLLGFFVVLMPKPFSWATVGLSVWTWVGIYLVYAIGSVALWLIAARPWRKPEDVHSPDAAPGA